MPTNAWGDPMRRPVNGVNVNIKIQTEVTDENGDVKDEYLDPQLLCMQHADVWCVLGGHTELLHEALSSWDPGGAHGLWVPRTLGTCQLSSTSYLATVWRRFPTWSTTIPFSS